MARDYNAFDLFAGLADLSKKNEQGLSNTEWFDRLSAAAQKAAAPLVMMRWLSGTSDPAQIIRLNTVPNRFVFAGTADKSAVFKLLAIGTSGKSSRYSWIKGPASKVKTLSLAVISQYYEISIREASTYDIDAEDLLLMAEDLGWDADDIKKLSKEVQNGSSNTEKTSSKPTKRRSGK